MVDYIENSVWTFSSLEELPLSGGNYIFLLRHFQNAPYYSGETSNLRSRLLGAHQGLFAAGGRTFMRPLFRGRLPNRSHTSFAWRWHYYKRTKPETKNLLVWVPPRDFARLCPDEIKMESQTFWKRDVALLSFANSYKGNTRKQIESRIQEDIRTYYNELIQRQIDWRVPPRSRLMGKGSATPSMPSFTYQLADGQPKCAMDFFSSLASRLTD